MKRKFTNEDIRKEYDRFSRFYDLFTVPLEVLWFGRLRKRLLSELKGEILEIAIGSGRNLKYYSKNCKITGIDLSPKMLELAERKAEKLGIKADLREGNVEKLRFGKGKFDYVVDTLGLCTYPNPLKALKEMKRVCKKTGKILLLEHGISNREFVRRLQEKREKKHYQKNGCSLLRSHEELVRKAGLKIEKAERKMLGIIYLISARP